MEEGQVYQEAPAVPPPISHEFHQREGRRWPVLLFYLWLALIIAIGVVYGGRWIYRSIHKPSKTTTQTTAVKKNAAQNNSGQQTPAAGQNQNNNQADQSAGGQSNQTNQSDNNQKVGKTTPTNTPNTGPGNLVGVFTVATGGSAVLHYVITRKRRGA